MQGVVADSPANVVQIPRKVWTREEAHALVDLGLPDADKLELIQGELISKVKKRPHQMWRNRMQRWLNEVFGPLHVQSESPIDLRPADQNRINEPEPDLIVTAISDEEFPDRNAGPSDLKLVIEISDSTLDYDLKIKGPLYAHAGIAEYWVVDVNERRLIVHRQPEASGYMSIVSLDAHEEISPLTAPEAHFSLDRVRA